jgi:biopolymer transport protein ExbD
MMLGTSVKATMFNSLAGVSILNPKHARHKKSIFADLLLTALIDAFSILVIFLLMSFSSSGEILALTKDVELPKAGLGINLERHPVIKLENGKVYLEDKEIQETDLVAEMMVLREKFKEIHPNQEYPGIITIQADRRVKYEKMNSIIVASGNAGFSDIKFAILMK